MKIKHITLILSSVFIASLLLSSCVQDNTPLPFLGHKEINGTDTTYHTVPNFTFVNQDNKKVNNKTFEDKIFIIDYFFTSCPTICP